MPTVPTQPDAPMEPQPGSIIDLDVIEAYQAKVEAVLDRFRAGEPQALDAGKALLAEIDTRLIDPVLARIKAHGDEEWLTLDATEGWPCVVDVLAGANRLSVVVDVIGGLLGNPMLPTNALDQQLYEIAQAWARANGVPA